MLRRDGLLWREGKSKMEGDSLGRQSLGSRDQEKNRETGDGPPDPVWTSVFSVRVRAGNLFLK